MSSAKVRPKPGLDTWPSFRMKQLKKTQNFGLKELQASKIQQALAAAVFFGHENSKHRILQQQRTTQLQKIWCKGCTPGNPATAYECPAHAVNVQWTETAPKEGCSCARGEVAILRLFHERNDERPNIYFELYT